MVVKQRVYEAHARITEQSSHAIDSALHAVNSISDKPRKRSRMIETALRVYQYVGELSFYSLHEGDTSYRVLQLGDIIYLYDDVNGHAFVKCYTVEHIKKNYVISDNAIVPITNKPHHAVFIGDV